MDEAVSDSSGSPTLLVHEGGFCQVLNVFQNVKSGFKIEILYLDREFYAKKVITFLKSRKIPVIVPLNATATR
jgi:hypothetical protein